jgi:DNA-binding CsgD family transcriptional regulator
VTPGSSELSPRRAEVLALAAAGFTDKEIAELLCIRVRTVRFHFTQGCRVLRARTRSHAVALATARGLIDPFRPLLAHPIVDAS